MGEHRFATPFYPMAYGALVLTLAKLEEWTRSRMTGLSARGAAVLLLFLGFLLAARTLDLGVTRTRHFLRHPTTPLSTVVGDVERFAELARRHGLQDFSVLSVDVGGLLWEDRFRVVDLGGLTDRKIADTFRYRRDLAAFHDHLFDRVRPTFLYAYGCWADAAMLQEDPRLERLYDRLEPPFAPWKENPSLQLFLLKPEYRTEPIS